MRTLAEVDAEIAEVGREMERAQIASDGAKVSINSLFGKFGNRWSAFYSPELLLHVTLTGQLALLMLIEQVTRESGAKVVSANTDGIVVHARSDDEHTAALVVLREFEGLTGLTLEEDYLDVLAAQDVNNYLAVGVDGKTKGKGVFATPGLKKSPVYPIVAAAVAAYVSDGTPIADTVRACDDLFEFAAVRKASGGAWWQGQSIGKTCRWYTGIGGSPITTAKGHQVANADQAVSIARMPEGAALAMALADVDRGYYIHKAHELRTRCGA